MFRAGELFMSRVQAAMDNWFVNHLPALKTIVRFLFGIVWMIDGALKFQPGFSMIDTIRSAAQGSPAWLAPWFNFWIQITNTNSVFAMYSAGAIELILAFALILGFLRKIVYIVGFLYSLVIWSVPEAFGGPYGPASTDIGVGIIYAFVFLLLMMTNAALGPNKLSLDYIIEKKFPVWRRLAEIRSKKFG
jgi:uncharacterized membrane protein YphA (DoxX/SURF4 family)